MTRGEALKTAASAKMVAGCHEALHRLPIALTVADLNLPDAPIVVANAGFCTLSGFGEADVLGRNCRFLQGPHDNTEARAHLRHAISQRRSLQTILINRRADGRDFHNLLAIKPVISVTHGIALVIGAQFDLRASELPMSYPAGPHQSDEDVLPHLDEARRTALATRRIMLDVAMTSVQRVLTETTSRGH